MTVAELKKIPFDRLMDVFPENRMMWRDSGRWIIYESDDQDADVMAEQNDTETFQEFIVNFFAVQLETEVPDESGFLSLAVDVAIAQAESFSCA